MKKIINYIGLMLILAFFLIFPVGAVPVPDYTLYGEAYVNGNQLLRTDSATVSLKVDNQEIVYFDMGDVDADAYVLRVPMNSERTPGFAMTGDTAYIYINNVSINENPCIIGDFGTTIKLDIHAVNTYCGDSSCNGNETCNNCPIDCGQCIPQFPPDGCTGSWWYPCENAYDGNPNTLAQPSDGTIGTVYKNFLVSKNMDTIPFYVIGQGQAANGHECGLKAYFYNYSSGNYTLLINDISEQTLTHLLEIPKENLVPEQDYNHLAIMIQGAYYAGYCGTMINEIGTQYCGDTIVTNNEQCEKPNTNNNNFCLQSNTSCSGNKQGSRDAFGNCDSACGCAYDSFSYQCVQGQCGAACDSHDDCNDGNVHTMDVCLNTCMCQHTAIPFCGDNLVNNNEQCELPGTTNNNYCAQSTSQCSGKNLGTRDSFGNCGSSCGCVYDSFSYACVKGQCGAECSANTDCNDGNSHTTDYCDSGCACKHDAIAYCGDSIVNNNEQCELPSTTNNNYCAQSTTQCSEKKLGSRDTFGNCDSNCGCTYDNYVYQCVKGQCGADCAVNSDCNDANQYTTDYCDSGCVCHHDAIPYCGDGIISNNEKCELPNTQNNNLCSQSQVACQGTKQGTRDSYGNCNSACGCVLDSFSNFQCLKDACGAQCSADSDCNDQNQNTLDYCDNGCICHHDIQPYCGDGIVNNNERCELPNTQNNNKCTQSQTSCSGKKVATRDSYGNCDATCGCVYDAFSSYQCVKGQCGATCAVNADCNDGNSHTEDICLNDCTCSNTQIPYCGDGITQSTEECEMPGTLDDTQCTQTAQVCFGTRLGIRDAYGNCDSQCGCVEDDFNLICMPGKCGAECVDNDDCNDQNPNTLDSCSDSCQCSHSVQPYCGDTIINMNEQCELPNTNNNNYCAQSTTQCSGKKQATRDNYGNCNSVCGCTYDAFSNYQCIKGACGAACSVNSDCNDGNQYTKDTCDSGCLCQYIAIPYCGDNIINNNEQCELPNTQNNNKCCQTTTLCSGKKQGTRDAYGNCDAICGCVNDAFVYQCVKGQCGAQCVVDADCNDGNSHTLDYCDGGCICHHDIQSYCGDGTVNNNEQCELPNTQNNNKCIQSQTSCSGTKQGTRDSYGNCDSSCGCLYDSFSNFQCVKGACSAACSVNSDCNDQNPYTEDRCLTDCSCIHNPIAHCGDEIINLNEQCELPNTNNNYYCTQSITQCSGTKQGTRDAYGNCNSVCGCVYDSFSNFQCVKGACGAECSQNADCDDGNCHTTDNCDGGCLCHHDVQHYCGDGIVNSNERCELPNTQNNNKCTQSTTSCLGKKVATRDSYGNCDANCGCIFDAFSNYQCVKGQCGATCAVNSDCNDGNSHTEDICLNDCTCLNTQIPYCGDSITQLNEECEMPGTLDDTQCSQTAQVCFGTKLGIRDAYGNCDSQCGCVEDEFNLICSPGKCGAECIDNDDCNDQNPYTADTCLSNCLCQHTQIPHCGAAIVNNNEQCELPSTTNNNYCSQSQTSCSGKKQGTRDAFGNCNSVCGCVLDSFSNFQCVKDACNAECSINSDCDDGNAHTTDYCDSGCMCKHDMQVYCGDGIININEQCELPNIQNNNYCSQSTAQCLNTKLGTRDSYGSCSCECGCVFDAFSYVCVKGQCGATCAVDADCNDGYAYTEDYCSESCACTHTRIPSCGDGIVDAAEQCDDGNSINGDGCSETCMITYQCSDGVDNDHDKYIDMNDPGCDSSTDNSEYNELPKEELLISKIKIVNSEQLVTGDDLLTLVELMNNGQTNLKDIRITVLVPELDIHRRIGPFNLNKGNTALKQILLEIPTWASPGEYDAQIVVTSTNLRRVKFRPINVVG
jgi:cysteine-rich repeat protein